MSHLINWVIEFVDGIEHLPSLLFNLIVESLEMLEN